RTNQFCNFLPPEPCFTIESFRRPGMHRFHALLAVIALVVAAPVFAAAPQPWPWKSKAPPDPALATLSHIDDVTASATAGTVSVAVNAMAPAPRLHGAAACVPHGRSQRPHFRL